MPVELRAITPRASRRQLWELRSEGPRRPRGGDLGTSQAARGSRDRAMRPPGGAPDHAAKWLARVSEPYDRTPSRFECRGGFDAWPSQRCTEAISSARRQIRARKRCREAVQSRRHNRAERCRAADIPVTARGHRQEPGYKGGARYTSDSLARSRYLAPLRSPSAAHWTTNFPPPQLGNVNAGWHP